LRVRSPQVSPWRVIAAQVVVGCLSAAVLGLFLGHSQVIGSALYGAATVVVPAALMARGMTSSLSSMSPGSGAVSFVLWEFVKIAVTVLMLMLAPKIVQPLYWPALLVSLVLCLQVYWVALSWRGRSKV
jgi:ATP synthase protein I